MTNTIKTIAQKLIDNKLDVTKENIIKMLIEETEFLSELVDRKTDRSKQAFDKAMKTCYCALVVS